jgi:hypothetical protein
VTLHLDVSDILTSGAVIVALLTWFLTYQRERVSTKTARTAEIIANFSLSEPLAEASFQLSRRINKGEKIDPAALDLTTERQIVTMLDYYEYLCEMHEAGVLSRRTIANIRGRLMLRTYALCEDYIARTREQQHRKVYESFERFVREFSEATGEPIALGPVAASG